MSYINQVLLTNNQAITNYDLSKVFLLNNRYLKGNYTNSGYSPITLTMGTIVGRVATTGEIVPCDSSASDGSEYPIGILAQNYTVAAGVEVEVMYCVCGDVAQEEIGFYNGTDTLNTVVGGRQYQDRIACDTVGIIIKPSVDLTDYDNS